MWTIIQGDARRIPLGDETVQCVVTSPPFWGLRDYGLPPSVWGGEEHEHEWGEWQEDHDEREAKQHGKSRTTDRFYGEESRRFDGNHQKHTAGSFCPCGAWLGVLGLEPTPELYIKHMVEIFREIRRVLRKDGTVWMNLGDSYAAGKQGRDDYGDSSSNLNNAKAGSGKTGVRHSTPTKQRKPPEGLKPKDLCGIPWRVALALQADGWWLRSDIIWDKPNPMPESVTDRPTRSHEYVFLLTKAASYYYDADAVREVSGNEFDPEEYAALKQEKTWKSGGLARGNTNPGFTSNRSHPAGRNLRSVWHIPTQPFSEWGETVHWERVSGDVSDDDIWSITSPDCSRHEGLFDLAAKCLCDEHGEIYLIRNFGTYVDLFLKRPNDYAQFGTLLSYLTVRRNSDWPDPENFLSAIDHNSEIRKRALSLMTSSSCIFCGGKVSGTGGKLKSLWRDDSAVHRLLNNTSLDGLACHPWVRNISDNGDNVSCCLLYKRQVQNTSHFATFPQALVEPCIKAGTSEKGCCAECGSPWERVVEKRPTGKLQKMGDGWATHDGGHGSIHQEGREAGEGGRAVMESTTLGWQPTCKHEGGPGPCLVLDPFAGSGTVGVVCIKLNRSFVGVELKPDYCEMANKRVFNSGSLLA